MQAFHILCLFFSFYQIGLCWKTLNNLVVPDDKITGFADSFDKQLNVRIKKPLKLTPPASCISARCLRIFYTGCLIGELALTDLNQNTTTGGGLVDVVEFVEYGEQGALGLVKVAFLAANDRSIVVVPMPGFDGSRGNYGYINDGAVKIDADYEILEEFVKSAYNRKIVFEYWIDNKNNSIPTGNRNPLQRTLLKNDTGKFSPTELDAWQTFQTAFRTKMPSLLFSFNIPKCKCIGDSYFGANGNTTGLDRLLASYVSVTTDAKSFGVRIVSTRVPTGFTTAGYLKDRNLGNNDIRNNVNNLVPHAILTVTLNESLLIGVTKNAKLDGTIDSGSTKLPGTSILVANADYGEAIPFPDKNTVEAQLKPLDTIEVDIKSSTAEMSVNGLPYTLIKV